MSNHLIIGLGGTGGRIIRAFRKILYQQFRHLHPEGVNIGYLYVDSDDELMALDDPSWKILGQSVQLGIDSQLHIQGADLNQRLENIHNYPGIQPWIGQRDDWQDILRSFAGGRIYGGQKRRLGRFLLACHAEHWVKQLSLQVNQLQTQSHQAEMTFHICCGLAGGTGSGSIIDVIAQIRKHYPYNYQGVNYTILAYTFLPEKNPNPKWDTGNYQANGYAALMELNALSAGQLAPYDITQGERLACEVAFNGLYLFTNQNEKNVIVEVSQELPRIVADFLYQKIVAVRHIAWPSLAFAEDAQNGDSTPETAPLPGSRVPERAKRFLTFGIHRIAIPEAEIKEYLTYQFARQAALQLQFNHWAEGFIDEPQPHSYTEWLNQPATQAHWLLTTEQLCLSKAILASDIEKKWPTLDEDWRLIAPRFQEAVLEHDKADRLEQLHKLFQKRFEQDFRSRSPGEIGGVEHFYRLKQATQATMAKTIGQHIETELFTDWKNGVKGLQDIIALVTAILALLTERKLSLAHQIAHREHQLQAAYQQVEALKHKWRQRHLFTPTHKLLAQQTHSLQNVYTHKTWLVALAFADKLLDELINELNYLLAQLHECANSLATAIQEFDTLIQQRLLLEDQTPLFDPARIKTLTQTLLKDETLQRACSSKIRDALVRSSHGRFSDFNQHFLDTMVLESAQNAQIGHDKLLQHPRDKLLGVNILAKLQERYAHDNQGLRLYIADLVKQACNYLSFDQAEIQKTGLGIPQSPTLFSRFTVILPQAQQQDSFITALKTAFRQSYHDEIEFLTSDVKPHEIVMINITNLFPLRFVSQVGFLQQKYQQRLNHPDRARRQLELHLEADGSALPPLFVPTQTEVKKQAWPYLLLAYTMQLIVTVKDNASGQQRLLYVQQDEDGFDLAPLELGEDLVAAYERLELTQLARLKQQVEAQMSHYEPSVLKQSIIDTVNHIKRHHCQQDITDERYQHVNAGGQAAMKILKGQL